MVSGSPQANVMTIGTFTIPLLKDSGYDSEWAAAITSTGACGGQIMPPIMGTAAFIMAQLLSVNYLAVAAAAFIPAVLYYYGAFVAVHYISKRYNIRGATEKIKVSLKDIIIIGFPILMFMVFLGFGYTVTYGAFWATIVSIVVCSITYFIAKKKLRPVARQTVQLIHNSAVDGAKNLLNIATLLAGSQITISLIRCRVWASSSQTSSSAWAAKGSSSACSFPWWSA
jgi:TRAP-type uncharacterized transport system fused permease subunit